MTDSDDKQILMIGRSTPFVEGIHDLLQVVGYPVRVSSSWKATDLGESDRPPDLIIVDLSSLGPDVQGLVDDIWGTPQWSDVPVLFLSFSGDARARDLRMRNNPNGQVYFYVHTLLSIDDLLDKVASFMA